MKIPLYEQIYKHLLSEVQSGQLKSGDRVPSENELSEQFGVSRITSKKALEKLVQTGIIERTQGKGSFVAEQLPDLSTLSVPDSNTQTKETLGLIGVVLPDFSDAYGLTTLRTLEQCCTQADYLMALRLSHGRRDEEEQAIQTLVQRGVEGLIIMPVHGEFYNAEVLRLVLNGFPFVLLDRYLKGIPAGAVYTDNLKASQELTTYLIERGHRNIAFVSPPAENTSAIEDRIQGYLAALSQAGLSHNTQYILSSLTSTMPQSVHQSGSQDDRASLRHFIAEHPEVTAFVACEYNIALLLHRVLTSVGKHYPNDGEIVCFDSPEAQFDGVTFTHVQQNEVTMARSAVEMLLNQIKGEGAPGHRVIDFMIKEAERL